MQNCLETSIFYHGALGANTAREIIRKRRPGKSSQYFYTLYVNSICFYVTFSCLIFIYQKVWSIWTLKGSFFICSSTNSQFPFTLNQTLDFVGPCEIRIAFNKGQYKFHGLNNLMKKANVQKVSFENRSFSCVLQLIEYYASKFSEIDANVLRYPVARITLSNIQEIGEPHTCIQKPTWWSHAKM